MVPRRALLAIALALPLLNGCSFLNNIYEGTRLRVDKYQDLAEIRQDTRQQLALERREALQMAAEQELRQLQVDLERQKLEMQFCQANIAQQQQQLQGQIRDILQSKIAFTVEQGLEVGELEVDVDALQDLLAQRQKQHEQAQTQQQNAAQKSTCEYGERFCGCAPGLRRKHCGRCVHQKCDCPPEKDCGGPAAYQQAQTSPQKSLRPQEIPMKLPVRLTFGMQNPRIESAQILRRPSYSSQQQQQQQQQKSPLQKDQACVECQQGHCTLHSYFINVQQPLPLPPPPIPSDR